MASNLQKMRGRRGYKGLLRGNRTMLGDIQIRKIRLASFLHGLQTHWIGYGIATVIIVALADCMVRDSFYNHIEFSSAYLQWFAITFVVLLVIFLAATFKWRQILHSDPYTAARDDAEHLLSEVRDSRGRKATADRIAGQDEAEFLCDFYEVRSLHWLGVIMCILLYVGLALSCIPHMNYYQKINDELVGDYLTTEKEIRDAIDRAKLCDEIHMSDDDFILYSEHYVRCDIEVNDKMDFTMTVDLDGPKEIGGLEFQYQFNQEITEIPNIDLINDYIVVLTASLEPVNDLTDGKILYYYYQIDDDFISAIEANGYQESSYAGRAGANDGDENVYFSYFYATYLSDEPTNYIRIYSY